MNQRFISRALIALMLMFTLGLVTIAAAPKASAHSLDCGSFTTILHRADLVAKGVTIGYGETLTDGCGNYELHGHLSALPAGSTGQSYLTLHSGNGTYISSTFFTAAPQDLYLNESAASRAFSPTTTTTNFYITKIDTNVSYSTGDFQHLVCGNFTTTLKKVDLVANGGTIGYLEALTDGCENKELHAHLSAMPAGSTGQSYFLIQAQNDDYGASQSFTTAPQDYTLGEVSSYSVSIPASVQLLSEDNRILSETGW